MKTICICLTFVLICSYGYSQSNKMSSKKSSSSSTSLIKEEKVTHAASHHKVKPAYEGKRQSAQGYHKVDDIVVQKSLANAARVKKANFASSKKYKNRQQAYLNEINSNSQNTHMHGGKKKSYDGKFGF